MDNPPFKQIQLPKGFRIGFDLIELSRIRRVYERFQNAFAIKILTSQEQEQFFSLKTLDAKISYLAKRWSAKEAFSKALGTGIGKSFSFSDLSVLSRPFNKPYCTLSSSFVSRYPEISIDLSWSDQPHTVGSVVLLIDQGLS